MSRADEPATDSDDQTFELTSGLNLTELVRRRQQSNRDISILITDSNNERGTGKTVLSLILAMALNESGRRLSTDHVFMQPQSLIGAYTGLPAKSPLVLDEAEADLGKYQAGSGVARAMRTLVSMGRVEEKYLIMNAPASTHVDRDLKSLFDVWITVQCRGEAHVHRLWQNEYDGQTKTPKVQGIRWSDIPHDHYARDVYDHLTRIKRERLSGDKESYFSADEVEERVTKAKRDAIREFRDGWLRQLDDLREEHRRLTQSDIADTIPTGEIAGKDFSISQSGMSKIINNE